MPLMHTILHMNHKCQSGLFEDNPTEKKRENMGAIETCAIH